MTNNVKILLVEDDPSLRMIICETLEIEGFKCICAEDGLEGLKKFSEEEFDVLIADIMMPHIDGLEMVARIRQRNKTLPILFLTAKSSVENVLEGFNAGADDYLRKPFSIKELIVRVKSLYSRAYGQKDNITNKANNLISIGSYMFDPISQCLYHNNDIESLSSKESEILHILANQMNETVASSYIMKTLWGDDSLYVANSLQVFITRLRRRLKKDPSVRIVNARGVGYRMVIDIPDIDDLQSGQ